MAQKKSDSGMSGGAPLSSMRDVGIPANPVPGAALSITHNGEFTILDYSQDYFTAKALEDVPPMGAVKMGPGGVLPRTSAVEPESPVIGVSVAGAASGEDAIILRSGKIAGKVFSPANSVLRTLIDGTVGVAAAGTIVGTVDSSGVGYVAVGSASSGGGAVGVSAEAGNIISEKPDGLFAQAKVSPDSGNSAEMRQNGLYVPAGGSGGGIYDLVDDTVVKMPYKLNGKQVYAYRFNFGAMPSSGKKAVAFPAGIPAVEFAWTDPTTSTLIRNVSTAGNSDTYPGGGLWWYFGVNIGGRQVIVEVGTNFSGFTAYTTVLFTRADGQ